MSQITFTGIGGTDSHLTVDGRKIYLGAHYNGGWSGENKSLSFNMGTGTALPRLNVMESGVRYEPVGENTGKSLSYPECWQGGYCDAQGHIATLPPDAINVYLDFTTFAHEGAEIHFGEYLMEWSGPAWFATLASNITSQGVNGDGSRWALIQIDADTPRPRFYWPDPATAGDYPRISRIVRTDRVALHDSGERWNPDFLAEIDGIMSHLRVMDAMGTNNSTVSSLGDIPPATAPHLSPWPPEIYTDLCNRLGVDCYICIPHLMALTGDLSTGEITTAQSVALMQRVDALLHPDLKIYVEYSNEYWNGAFDQFHEIYSAASTAGWNTADGSGFHPSMYGAKIQAHTFKAIKEAFGDRATTRVVCVAGTQAASTSVTQRLLDGQRWLEEDGAVDWFEPASFTDAVAIAPYLGSQWIETANEVQNLITEIDTGRTQSEIDAYMVGRLQALGLDTQPIDWINDQADVADDFNLPLIAYEGGTHVLHFFSVEGVTGDDVDKIAPALIEFSYSLAHWGLEEAVMDAWKLRGMGSYDSFSLFYRPNKFGAWGHERALGVDTPGELAKEAWQDANPRWWSDWRDFAISTPQGAALK